MTTHTLQMLTTPNRNSLQMKCIWLCCEHLQHVSLFVCVVSICTICCPTDENVFLICWCFSICLCFLKLQRVELSRPPYIFIFVYYKYAVFSLDKMLNDGLGSCGLMWCFYQLFLTAPIHCRGSIAEQVVFCKFSPNLIWWRNKLIYILNDLRVRKYLENFHFY